MPKPDGELARMLAKLSQMEPQEVTSVLQRLEPEARAHAEVLLTRSTNGAFPPSRKRALRDQGLSAWMIDRIEGRHPLADATRIAISEIAERLRSDDRSGSGNGDLER